MKQKIQRINMPDYNKLCADRTIRGKFIVQKHKDGTAKFLAINRTDGEEKTNFFETWAQASCWLKTGEYIQAKIPPKEQLPPDISLITPAFEYRLLNIYYSDKYEPFGKFLRKTESYGTTIWRAINNATGQAYTEEFYTQKEAVAWLSGDVAMNIECEIIAPDGNCLHRTKLPHEECAHNPASVHKNYRYIPYDTLEYIADNPPAIQSLCGKFVNFLSNTNSPKLYRAVYKSKTRCEYVEDKFMRNINYRFNELEGLEHE